MQVVEIKRNNKKMTISVQIRLGQDKNNLLELMDISDSCVGQITVPNEIHPAIRMVNRSFHPVAFTACPIIKDDMTVGAVIELAKMAHPDQHSKLKDDFISTASHELRTPITSIKLYMELLLEMFKNSEDSQSLNMLLKMNRQVDRMESLVTDLLDVSQMEQGCLKLELNDFSFKSLLDNIVEEFQLTTMGHVIVIKNAKDITVKGDQNRLGQVITNFLSNAIKYSPDEKLIEITYKVVNDSLYCSVRDFGIGLSQENKAHVFDRFYRVERDINKYKGLGLGLFIASEIIKAHSGEIGVESKEGGGSNFYFKIPLPL